MRSTPPVGVDFLDLLCVSKEAFLRVGSRVPLAKAKGVATGHPNWRLSIRDDTYQTWRHLI